MHAGSEPPRAPPGAGALLFHPKGRARLEMSVRFLVDRLDGGATFWIVGARAEGIGSAHTALTGVGRLVATAAGRHARILRAEALAPDTRDATLARAIEGFMTETTEQVGDRSIVLCSLPGVFSHGVLDDGTRLLLETVPALPGPLLDVGAGCGVLGAWYGGGGAVSPILLDADALAVEASRATLRRNAVKGVVVHGDVLPNDGRFASIVSNPPFHQGVKMDYSVTEALIRGAPARLLPGGTLTLVCNRFLPVQDLLDAAFGGHRVLADDGRYRVLQAAGPG